MLFWNKCLVENEIPKAVALWLNNLQDAWWACYKGGILATSRGFQVSGSFFYFPDTNLTWGQFSNCILNLTALQRRVTLKVTFRLFGWVSVAGFMCSCVFSGEKVAEKRNKTQVLLMDRKAWCAVHGVGKSRTGLNGWTEMECFLLPNVLRTLHKKHSETLMTSIGYSIPIPRKSMRGLRLCTLSSYSILSTQESAWHKQQLNKYWNKRTLTGL